MPLGDSNPQFQQTSARRPTPQTARPPDRPFYIRTPIPVYLLAQQFQYNSETLHIRGFCRCTHGTPTDDAASAVQLSSPYLESNHRNSQALASGFFCSAL